MNNQSDLNPILIIDDEPAILKFLTLSLSRRGYFVDTAGTGKEGMEKIAANNYSLILTDVKMPDVSGIMICNYLRNTVKKSTPIVCMSGTPWLLDQQKFDDVLAKPCSIKEIMKVISRLI
ncbi:response regulator transcription factor [Desulfobacula sp.]